LEAAGTGGGRGGNVNMRLEMIHMFDVDMVWYTPLILLYGHGHGHVVVMSIIVISRLDIRMMSGRDIMYMEQRRSRPRHFLSPIVGMNPFLERTSHFRIVVFGVPLPK
jgi:hypothetical protein